MARRRFVQRNGELIEVGLDYVPEPKGPMVIGDLPAYQSPIDGKPVEGRAQRREDLKRSGCRPWEGMAAEKKEAARQQEYQRQHLESRLHDTAMRTFYELSPEKRRILTGSR